MCGFYGRVTCFGLCDLSLDAWTPLRLHSDHLTRIVRCRALSGCCVATSLMACPGLAIAWELIPLGRGDWGRHCKVLPGLKLGNPFTFIS